MNGNPKDLQAGSPFDGLRELFRDMDEAYDRVASAYGFRCDGCGENCCRTRFSHHTHLEREFLQSGFVTLTLSVRRDVKHRAETVCEKDMAASDGSRPMCPLNENGRCLVYDHRPMICRLHGLPHELRKPGGPAVLGPGCPEFHRRIRGGNYIPFDRTPFYSRMALLENAFRSARRIDQKIKMTIAEMIRTF